MSRVLCFEQCQRTLKWALVVVVQVLDQGQIPRTQLMCRKIRYGAHNIWNISIFFLGPKLDGSLGPEWSGLSPPVLWISTFWGFLLQKKERSLLQWLGAAWSVRVGGASLSPLVCAPSCTGGSTLASLCDALQGQQIFQPPECYCACNKGKIHLFTQAGDG